MKLLVLGLCLLGVAQSVGQQLGNDDRYHRSMWQRISFDDGDDQARVLTPEDPDGDGVVGAAGKDYPVLRDASRAISFKCDGRLPGMYADVDAGCQVYHVCQSDMRKEIGLCVNGTIFNQETFSCDWWYNVDCSKAPEFYALNVHLGKPYTPSLEQQQQVQQRDRNKPAHRHLDIHPERQSLRRKLRPSSSKVDTPQHQKSLISNPTTIRAPLIHVIPVEASVLSHQEPSRVRIQRKKIRRPIVKERLVSLVVPQNIDLQHNTFSSPTRQLSPSPLQKQRQQHLKLRPFVIGNDGGRGQYARAAFDPALHLPRPKPLSLKKLAAKELQQQQLIAEQSRDPSMKPMMFPVKSDDTIAGYSDMYLNKPVDED